MFDQNQNIQTYQNTGNNMSDLLKQATSLFSPEQKKKEWYEELEEEVCSICPVMTYQQRLIGCAVCMSVGFFLSCGSLFRLIQLVEGNPAPFAIMYTIGNIVSLSSTCFIYGPWSQVKKMVDSTRIITTIIYFSLMALTLFLAFYPNSIPGRALWLVLAIFFQFLALSWYTLSFIPFARDFVLNLIKSCCFRMVNENESTGRWPLTAI